MCKCCVRVVCAGVCKCCARACVCVRVCGATLIEG